MHCRRAAPGGAASLPCSHSLCPSCDLRFCGHPMELSREGQSSSAAAVSCVTTLGTRGSLLAIPSSRMRPGSSEPSSHQSPDSSPWDAPILWVEWGGGWGRRGLRIWKLQRLSSKNRAPTVVGRDPSVGKKLEGTARSGYPGGRDQTLPRQALGQESLSRIVLEGQLVRPPGVRGGLDRALGLEAVLAGPVQISHFFQVRED